MMFAEYRDIVSVEELMTMLKVGKNKAYELVNSGQIESFRIGRSLKIPKSSIINYISQQSKSCAVSSENSTERRECIL